MYVIEKITNCFLLMTIENRHCPNKVLYFDKETVDSICEKYLQKACSSVLQRCSLLLTVMLVMTSRLPRFIRHKCYLRSNEHLRKKSGHPSKIAPSWYVWRMYSHEPVHFSCLIYFSQLNTCFRETNKRKLAYCHVI